MKISVIHSQRPIYSEEWYHHHRQQVDDSEGESSSKREESQIWKSIWKMKNNPSVKSFIWRACNETLPTLANLKTRKVVMDSLCPICRLEPETFGHVLWSCGAAKDIWAVSFIKVQKMSISSDLFINIWANLTKKLIASNLEEVANILREIWDRRNAYTHE